MPKDKQVECSKRTFTTSSSYYRVILESTFLRSKNGYKNVLSAICLASRFPEAIALKDVRAGTVAEGKNEIFSQQVYLDML